MDYCVLFPAFPDALREPDPEFQKEWDALDALGIPWRVFSYEAFIDGDLERAFRFLKTGSGETLLYRGWILKEEEHRRLTAELQRRGYSLFTDTAAYARALRLPTWYHHVRDVTPSAVWTNTPNAAEAWRLAQQVGPGPWILKDHVKSAKHRWNEACFIPADATRERFFNACAVLHEWRGDRFEHGFVVRPYVPLRYLEESGFGHHIFEEYRLFFCRGELLVASLYDRVGGARTDFSDFAFLADRIDSPFFSADIAHTADDCWILIEVGDGGVSGLPPRLDPKVFHTRLREMANRPYR